MDFNEIIQNSFLKPMNINGVSMLLFIISLSIFVTMILYIKKYMQSTNKINKYYILSVFLIINIFLIMFSKDIISMYIFTEAITLSLIIFKGYNKNSKLKIDIRSKYNYFQILGSVLIILCTILFITMYKTVSVNQISEIYIVKSPYSILEKVIILAFIIGYGIKILASIFMLYNYKEYDIYNSTFNFIIISNIYLIGLFLLIKVIFSIFYLGSNDALGNSMLISSLVLLILAVFKIYKQKDINKLISQILLIQIEFALLAIALSILTTSTISVIALVAALYQILNSFLVNLLLLITSSYIVHNSGSLNIDNMSGLNKKIPFIMTIFIFALFSMIGVPPFTGFTPKLMIYELSLANDNLGITFITIFVTVVLTLIAIKIIGSIFFGPTEISEKEHSYDFDIGKSFISVITFIVFMLGIFSTKTIKSFLLPSVTFMKHTERAVMLTVGSDGNKLINIEVNDEWKLLAIFIAMFITITGILLFKGKNAGEEIKEGQDTVFDLSIFKKYNDELKFNQKKSQARFVEGCKYDVFIGGEEGDKIKFKYEDMFYNFEYIDLSKYYKYSSFFIKNIKITIFSIATIIIIFSIIIYLFINI